MILTALIFFNLNAEERPWCFYCLGKASLLSINSQIHQDGMGTFIHLATQEKIQHDDDHRHPLPNTTIQRLSSPSCDPSKILYSSTSSGRCAVKRDIDERK